MLVQILLIYTSHLCLKNPFELERSHCFLSCTWKVRPNMPCGHEKMITDIVCTYCKRISLGYVLYLAIKQTVVSTKKKLIGKCYSNICTQEGLPKKYIRSTCWKINDHQILYTLNIWKNVFRILDSCKSSILLCKSDFCTMFCKHLVFCQRLWEKNSSYFSQFEFIYIYVNVNYDVRFSWGCLIYNLRY